MENLHLSASMYHSSYVSGQMDGRKEGLEQGEKIGREQGQKEGAVRIAAKLLDLLDDKSIAARTGLRLKEVRRLGEDAASLPRTDQ